MEDNTMMMGFRLGQTVSQKLTHSLQHRLTLSEKLAVLNQQIGHRLALIEAVRGVNYKPAAVCPECGRNLTTFEILDGFNDDPHDYTTSCPNCRHRFPPQLKARLSEASTIEVPFYCEIQTLDQLRGMTHLDPERIRTEHHAIYHSAILHFGTLRRAFDKLGVQYPYEEIPNWKEKIAKFLGKLPDKVIAGYVDQSARAIAKIRKSLGIEAYRIGKAIEEAV